ncbi:MAG: DUF5658 family protein [Opitutaceae bacterium]
MAIPLRAAVIGPRPATIPVNLQLLALLLALNLADVLLTHINVTLGLSFEANPILGSMLENYGWPSLYLFKVVGPVVLSLTLVRFASLMTARWFSGFLCLLCLLSLSGVCSGVFVIACILY